MQDYLFILGRNPELSLLEIAAYFKRKKMQHTIKEHTPRVVLVALPKINIELVMRELGGTIKIAQIIETSELLYQGQANSITYAITAYETNKEKIEQDVKQHFKQEQLKATQRYKKLDNISPSKSRLLDLELIGYKNKLARVVAVSNPRAYKQRDERRPKFDPLKVISIRLAKMLINISEVQDGQTLLDPFVGYGTILQEALLLNCNVIGLDNELESVQSTTENMKWLGNKYKEKWDVIKGDSTKLTHYIQQAHVVVSEPYLGPFLKKVPTDEEAQKIAKEITAMYAKLLPQLSSVVTGKIVLIVPEFRSKNHVYELPMQQMLQKAQLKLASPIKGITLPISYETGGITHIGRYIYVLEKLK